MSTQTDATQKETIHVETGQIGANRTEATHDHASIAQFGLKLPPIKPIHIQAENLVKESVAEFENGLRLQANTLAKNDELVLSSHVREAITILRRRNSTARKWKEDFSVLFGGALFGAFLSGLPNELSMLTPRNSWISFYVIIGIIGLLLAFYGYAAKDYK